MHSDSASYQWRITKSKQKMCECGLVVDGESKQIAKCKSIRISVEHVLRTNYHSIYEWSIFVILWFNLHKFHFHYINDLFDNFHLTLCFKMKKNDVPLMKGTVALLTWLHYKRQKRSRKMRITSIKIIVTHNFNQPLYRLSNCDSYLPNQGQTLLTV